MSNIPEPLNPFDWLKDQQAVEEQAAKDNEAAIEQANREAREFANLVNEVLGSGRGAELMARLEDYTIRLPLLQTNGSLVRGDFPLSPSDWAFIREGQNSVWRFLDGQIAFARTPELPPQQNEESQSNENG